MTILRISIFRVPLYSNIAFYKAWAGLSISVDSNNWTYEYVKWLYEHINAFISSCLFSSDGETHWEKGISTIRLILIYVIKQIISLLLISPIDYSVDAMQRPTSHFNFHCSDVIMSTMASQITSLTIVYLTVYSGVDQKRKHQSSASLTFVRRIQRWPVNSPPKWQVTRKMFPFDDAIMCNVRYSCQQLRDGKR